MSVVGPAPCTQGALEGSCPSVCLGHRLQTSLWAAEPAEPGNLSRPLWGWRCNLEDSNLGRFTSQEKTQKVSLHYGRVWHSKKRIKAKVAETFPQPPKHTHKETSPGADLPPEKRKEPSECPVSLVLQDTAGDISCLYSSLHSAEMGPP